MTRTALYALHAHPPRAVRAALWGLFALGLGANIAFGLLRHSIWAYAYLANFLFFTGLAQCGVLWAAVTRGCNGRWARPLHRLSEMLSAVLPLSVVLFLPIVLARRTLFPWMSAPPARKLPWLQPGFLLGRDLAILAALAALSLWYLRRSRDGGKLGGLWVGVIFAYVYGYSVLGLDLNMSLNPGWYDYIYGWYFLIANWYAGLALISVLAVAWRRRLEVTAVITVGTLHDNAELTFGFCIFWAYLFWAQFMVLWYANRRDDILVFQRLIHQQPWAGLGWLILALGFFVPFAMGLSRSWKRRPATILLMSGSSLLAIWLERNVVVNVSLNPVPFPPLAASALVGCGFVGLYGLVYLAALARVPAFPTHDPMMAEALVIHPVRH